MLVDFVERKLQGFRNAGAILPDKVMPDVQVLAEAYRMFKREPHIQAAVAAEKARLGTMPVPADLERQVRGLSRRASRGALGCRRRSPRQATVETAAGTVSFEVLNRDPKLTGVTAARCQ